MLHACFTPIPICFVYTSWHFYAFSGTNLLTRCHSASSLFSAVFGFRKSIKEIFSELDETWTRPPIFPTRTRSPKERRRSTLCRAVGWCGPPAGLRRRLFGLLEYSEENRPMGFCFVRFREYLQKYFSGNKNSRKQGTGTVASC